MNIIIEAPFQVLSAKLHSFSNQFLSSLNPTFENSSEEEANECLVLRCPKLFLLVHLETGAVLRNYTPLNADEDIIDCAYVPESRTFIVLSNSGFVVTVPESCIDFSRCDRLKWAVKPLTLFCKSNFALNNRKSLIVIACSDGSYCQISLSTDGHIVPSPSQHLESPRNDSISTQLFAGPSYDNNFCSIYETKDKKTLAMKRYNLFEQSPGSCHWLKETTEVTLSLAEAHNPASDLEVVAVIVGESSDSIYVLLSASILIKFSREGRLLFRRSVQVGGGESSQQDILQSEESTNQKKKRKSLSKGHATLTAKTTKSVEQFAEVAGQLWILHSQGSISCWSSTYGTLLQTVVLPGTTVQSLEGKLFWFLPLRFEATNGGDKNGIELKVIRNHSFAYLMIVLHCVMAGTARGCQVIVASSKDSSTTVFRFELSAESSLNVRNKLSDAVGALAKKKNVVVEQNLATIEGGKTSVVSKIDAPEEKKVVLGCLESFSAELSKLEEFRKSVEGKDALYSVEQKNQSKFYLPSEIGKIYLERIRAVGAGDLSSEDWTMLLAVIHSRTVSILSSPFLLQLAAQNFRMDVFKEMILHVADFSELHCVKVLRFCLLLPDDALVQAFSSLGITIPRPKKKSRKNADNEIAGSSILLYEDGSSNFPGQRIVLLQEMMHSCLSRESAYSPVLLSEAVRDALSPEMAASFLRILASILGGLCSEDAAAAISWSRWIVLDEHIKRAVSWMEAILDGHFSAIALNVCRVMLDEPTRKGLTAALKVVMHADVAATGVEDLLGVWTHISRIITHGSQE
eukprot:gene20500-26594_t